RRNVGYIEQCSGECNNCGKPWKNNSKGTIGHKEIIAMNDKIWLSSPHMGGNELEYIQQAFDANWVAPLGPNVNGFESDLEKFLGADVKVAALSAGTAA